MFRYLLIMIITTAASLLPFVAWAIDAAVLFDFPHTIPNSMALGTDKAAQSDPGGPGGRASGSPRGPTDAERKAAEDKMWARNPLTRDYGKQTVPYPEIAKEGGLERAPGISKEPERFAPPAPSAQGAPGLPSALPGTLGVAPSQSSTPDAWAPGSPGWELGKPEQP
jgi:hypothetical protein